MVNPHTYDIFTYKFAIDSFLFFILKHSTLKWLNSLLFFFFVKYYYSFPSPLMFCIWLGLHVEYIDKRKPTLGLVKWLQKG